MLDLIYLRSRVRSGRPGVYHNIPSDLDFCDFECLILLSNALSFISKCIDYKIT